MPISKILSGSLDSGKVLQVVQTIETGVASFTSTTTNTYVNIPNMEVTITPTSSTSKILVTYSANVTNSTTATTHVRCVRNSTPIGAGATASARIGSGAISRIAATPYDLRISNLNQTILDAPATTSSITYRVQGVLGASYSGTFYLNRSANDYDADFSGRTASSITVIEISG